MAAVVDDAPKECPRVSDLIEERRAKGVKSISFEYFPPKTADGRTNLEARIERMGLLKPVFMDMTWGAGGSTSDLTLELCKSIKAAGQVPNMHLTCTNMPEDKITEALKGCKEAGIRNIVALRGDPPRGQAEWKATEGGFTCALDLVKHIRKEYGDYFCLAVAGYPEGHPNTIKKVEDEASLTDSEKQRAVSMPDGLHVCSDADFEKELAYLKAKVDAGADLIITQMFFDETVFVSFKKACEDAGIKVPILPGIMMLQNAGGFDRMTSLCKTRVPASLKAGLDEVRADPEAVKKFGLEEAVRVCKALLDAGAVGLHLYTLNQDKATHGVLQALDMSTPEFDAAAQAHEEAVAARKKAKAEADAAAAAAAAAKEDASGPSEGK